MRSLAGVSAAVSRPKERHVLQFKIGCLELERSRRQKEKDVALERIRGIDSRIAAIAAEILGHHEVLGYGGLPPASRDAGGFDDRGPGSSAPRRTIRYGG